MQLRLSNDDLGAGEPFEILLDNTFSNDIQRAGCFIQQQ